MNHTFKDCGRDSCGGNCAGCQLAICSVCGLIDGSLTTDCPGVPSYAEKSDDVYAGRIDFVDGVWVEQCSRQSPRAFDETTVLRRAEQAT